MPTFTTYQLYHNLNPLTPNEVWSGITSEVSSQEVEYHQVKFPLMFNGNDFSMETDKGNLVNFKMNNEGARHFAHSLRLYPHVTRGLITKHEEPNEFTFKVNQGAAEILVDEGKEWFTLSVVNGVAYGLLHNYNPVDHTDLLNTVDSEGLSGKISYAILNHRMLELFFSGKTTTEGEYGLVIRNGVTGTVSLEYGSYYRVKDDNNESRYIYYFNDNKKVLHLSTVAEWNSRFEVALNELMATRVESYLQGLTVAESTNLFATFIRGIKNDKHQAIAKDVVNSIQKNNGDDTLYDAIPTLVEMFEHGKKGIISKLIDFIFENASEKVGNE